MKFRRLPVLDSRFWVFFVLLSCFPINGASAQNGYLWGSVAMGGGGYVTGVTAHPKRKDLIYIRTDVGGFYRWDAMRSRWIPLTDAFSRSESNYYGGEGIALDPNDTNVVYIAAGKYSADWGGAGALFKSVNQGATWKKLNFPAGVAVRMGGNENLRWSGERLAVCPSNSKIILFGSRNDNLWRSIDSGNSWSKIAFGKPEAGIGITCVTFDKANPGSVFAGVYGDGVYRSVDHGARWTKLIGSPVQPYRIASGGGRTYVSHETGVARWNLKRNEWHNITPENLTNAVFCGLSVNPLNPAEVIVARNQTDADARTNGIYLSRNGGETWETKTSTVEGAPGWWGNDKMRLPAIAAVEFDPHQNGRVYLTDWYGVHRTDAIAAPKVMFTTLVHNLEEMVVFGFSSPPANAVSGRRLNGALLLSGIADNDGFHHTEGFDRFPSRAFVGSGGPWFQDTYSITYCPSSPTRMIRVGGNRWSSANHEYHDVAVSADQGKNWSKTSWDTSLPGVRPLRIAVSATSADNFVVVTDSSAAQYSKDNGVTYQPVTGLPRGPGGPWFWGQPLTADTVSEGTFYYYASQDKGQGSVYRSNDNGANFTVVNSSLPAVWDGILKAVPGVAGEIWLGLKGKGLRRSTDGGVTFSPIIAVQEAHLFAFGKPAPTSVIPTLFVMGKVDGKEGIFRSGDRGATWRRIDDPRIPIGNEPNSMEASMQTFGLIFIGTNGRGAYYGLPK